MSEPWERRQFLRLATLGSLGAITGTDQAIGQEAVRVVPKHRFLTSNSPGYNAAKQLFNSRLQFKPAFVAMCQSEADVAAAVKHAHLNRLQVTVKSGGHSFEGFSSNNNGMMINVGDMTKLDYDSKTQTIKAQPGCRLGQVGQVLFGQGRLLPSGSCAGVGLAGLTLGGGYGLFARKHGLTCDHLIGVRMVDGRGEIHDSADDPEQGEQLLKVCRGGGNGNFGIITELRFSTVTAPTRLSAQRIRYRKLAPEKVAKLAKMWFAITENLPNDGFSAFVLNGSSLTILITFFDPQTRGYVEQAFEPMRQLAWKNEPILTAPTARAVTRYYGRPGPLPFKNASAGYYKNYQHIAEVVPKIAQQVAAVSGTVWQINTLGGKIGDKGLAEKSVYPHRHYAWLGEIQGYWNRPDRESTCVANVAKVQAIIAAAGVKDHYRNYPDIEFNHWQQAYYGPSGVAQIEQMKRRYDRDNIIRHPQSIALPEAE